MGERESGLHRSVVATVAAAAGLLGVFLLQGTLAIAHHAPTYDEAAHLASGYSMLAMGDFRLNPQVPPLVKILLASPLYLGSGLAFTPDPAQWRDAADYPIGQAFLYGSARPADEILATGRFANLALGAGLVVLIGWWAGRLWGRAAAIVAIALAALEPNLVAHSSLVTTDVGATLFMVLTLYLLWEATSAKSPAQWLATGLSAGLAMAAKYSTLTLIPILGAILAGHVLLGGIIKDAPWALPAGASPRWQRLIQAVSVIPLLGVPATLVVLAAYFFQGLHPWWFGLLRFLEQANAGQPAYFLGHYSHAGWWTYFPVSFLIKTPVATLVVIAASLALCRMGTPLSRRDVIFLLAPVAVVFLVSAQVKTNIGLRHILVVYPLLFVLASRVATFSPRRVWLVPVLAGSAIAATAASTLPVTPHQLAYFNELVGGPEHGHRYLSDSNIDWGQDLRGIKGFMDQQGIPIAYLSYFGSAPPAYYGIRYQYVPGSWPLEWPPPRAVVPATLARKVLIISISNLQGVHTHFTSPDLFAWLRTRRPIARIGYSILVYDLSGDAEALGALAETYRRMGLAALPDAQRVAGATTAGCARRGLRAARASGDPIAMPIDARARMDPR